MKKTILALMFAAAATTSFAWSDREQGALLGLIIGGHIVNRYQQPQTIYTQPTQVYVAPQTLYYQPTPIYVQPSVVYLQDGTRLTYSYLSGLWLDSQNRAYNLPR